MRLTPRTARILLTTALALGGFAITVAPAAAQDEAKIKRGQSVYTAQKCQVCHAIAGKGGKASPLDGVGTKLTAAEIEDWIKNPKDTAAKVKSTKKPPMQDKYGKLPAEDLEALVAYMQSLK
jgi:mono/diheme cytochrome c family protein